MKCECGCGQAAPIATHTSVKYGRVKGKPCRFINGHNSKLQRPGVNIDPVTGCWNWNGNRSKTTGYGTATRIVDGVKRQGVIHRFYYEEHKGPIPPGLVIDHLCRNVRCVNPDHLEAVTQKINVQRSARCNKSLRVEPKEQHAY